MVRQFKETSIEGKRLLHLGMAACMLMLVMVICHAEPVFAKNFEMDLDANKVTYTLTEAKSGSVIFGEANTTGYIYIGQKPDTFVVKNDTDKVIRVGMYVTTESPVTLTWFADFGPSLMSQTINRSESAVITGQTAKPGEEVSVQYGYIKEENKNVKTLPRLKVIARITVTDEPVYKTVVKKEPKIEVTKMSADQAGIQVDVNNGGAEVRGVSKIYVCNGVQREHNKKLNNGLPILHKVPPKRDYGRYFCIMAEKGGTSHGGLTEKLSPFFHAKKQEVNAYGR